MTVPAAPAGKPRIESVDALRGMLACGIMLFHTTGWTGILQDGLFQHFWNWLGIYGVEMFFVISGFSMAYVYSGKPLLTAIGLKDFYWKRFMRLWPLYVAAFAVATAFRMLTHDMEGVNWRNALLHTSLLFGFIDPSIKGIIGGWSIGVEVVCYAAFPLLMAAMGRPWPRMAAVSVLATGSVAWTAWQLDSRALLAPQWAEYVSPVNHLFLFAVGMYLAVHFQCHQPARPAWVSRAGLAVLLAIAVCSPLAATDTATVTGVGRLVFVLLAAWMAWISIAQVETPKPFDRVFNPIGLWSYSIYLLHPFAFQALKLVGLGNFPAVHAVLTIAGTLGLSALSYKFLERPSVEWARRKSAEWFAPGVQTVAISDSSSR